MLPGALQPLRLPWLPCAFPREQGLEGRTGFPLCLPGHGHFPGISCHALHLHLELAIAMRAFATPCISRVFLSSLSPQRTELGWEEDDQATQGPDS